MCLPARTSMGVSSMVISALTSSADSSPDLESDILKFTSALKVAEIVARASLSRTCAWGSPRTGDKQERSGCVLGPLGRSSSRSRR